MRPTTIERKIDATRTCRSGVWVLLALFFLKAYGLSQDNVISWTSDKHSEDQVDAARREVSSTAARFDFLIDFLRRTQNLNDDQIKRLKTAAKGVGEKQAEKTFARYGENENPVMRWGGNNGAVMALVNGRRVLLAAPEPDDPNSNSLWQRTTKKILTKKQHTAMRKAQSSRKNDDGSLIARLDHTLYLDSQQRAALEPLLDKKGHHRTGLKILPAELSGIDKHKVREILSEIQFQGWSDIMQGKMKTPGEELQMEVFGGIGAKAEF